MQILSDTVFTGSQVTRLVYRLIIRITARRRCQLDISTIQWWWLFNVCLKTDSKLPVSSTTQNEGSSSKPSRVTAVHLVTILAAVGWFGVLFFVTKWMGSRCAIPHFLNFNTWSGAFSSTFWQHTSLHQFTNWAKLTANAQTDATLHAVAFVSINHAACGVGEGNNFSVGQVLTLLCISYKNDSC